MSFDTFEQNQRQHQLQDDEQVWLFGYGSLIYLVDFPCIESCSASIRGWSRRFWQGSHDHRGTPEFPGRVVTLIESTNEHCHGMAFRLPVAEATDIIKDLDYREKGGYDKTELSLTLKDGRKVVGVTYIAYPKNPNYLGDSPLEDIARQISFSTGPSGSNKEYILELHTALNRRKRVGLWMLCNLRFAA